MPTALNLQRNSEVFFSTVDIIGGDPVTAMRPVNTWKLEVLSGFSVSADSATQDITPMESGNNQDRSVQRYNTAINPVSWNVKTYVKPTKSRVANGSDLSDGNIRAIADWFMWQSLVSNTAIASGASGQSVWRSQATLLTDTRTGAANVFPTTSQIPSLTPYQLYFKLDNTVYQVKDAVTNKLTIDAAINEIVTDTWEGMGSYMQELTGGLRDNAISVFGGILNSGTAIVANANVRELTAVASYHPYTSMNVGGVTLSHATLPNRLTYVEANWSTGIGGTTYNYVFPITSLTFSVDNGVKYLTPEELSNLNRPIGNITGARTVSGSFSTYLRNATSSNLFNQLLTDTRVNSANFANLKLAISGTTPNVVITLDSVQFQFPQLAVDDISALNIDFLAVENTATGNEFTVKPYY